VVWIAACRVSVEFTIARSRIEMDVPKSLDVLTEPFDAVTRSVCRSKSLFDQYLHQPDVSKTSIDRRGTSSWVAPDTQAIAEREVSTLASLSYRLTPCLLESNNNMRLCPLHPMVRNLIRSVSATFLVATTAN
jgi:hypothetical protein